MDVQYAYTSTGMEHIGWLSRNLASEPSELTNQPKTKKMKKGEKYEEVEVTEEQIQELEHLVEKIVTKVGADKAKKDFQQYLNRQTMNHPYPKPRPKLWRIIRTVVVVAVPTLIAIGSSVYLMYLSWGIRDSLQEAVKLLRIIAEQ